MLIYLNAGAFGIALWGLLCLLLSWLRSTSMQRLFLAGCGFFCVLSLAYCLADCLGLGDSGRAALSGGLAGVLVHCLEHRARRQGRGHYWDD